MLRGRLPFHIEMLAKRPQRLPIVRAQNVKNLPPAWISQRLEHFVRVLHHDGHCGYKMQVTTCMSSPLMLCGRNSRATGFAAKCRYQLNGHDRVFGSELGTAAYRIGGA
jgi:hypothetical protein